MRIGLTGWSKVSWNLRSHSTSDLVLVFLRVFASHLSQRVLRTTWKFPNPVTPPAVSITCTHAIWDALNPHFQNRGFLFLMTEGETEPYLAPKKRAEPTVDAGCTSFLLHLLVNRDSWCPRSLCGFPSVLAKDFKKLWDTVSILWTTCKTPNLSQSLYMIISQS